VDPEPGHLLHFILLLDVPPELPLLAIGLRIVVFWALLVVSFLVSGAEVAFFSLSKPEIEAFRSDENNKTAQRIWHLIKKPAHKYLLATILITNNLVNVAAILVANDIISELAAAYALNTSREVLGVVVQPEYLLKIVISTLLLLLFGEIVPKVYAAKNRIRMVKSLALPLYVLKRLLAPLSMALIRFSHFIESRIQLKDETTSLEDLKHAIDLATNDIELKDEKEILKGIVNFSNIPVKSIMRARVDVIAIEVNTPLSEIIEIINEHSFSRMPVYEENLDEVLGILHIKDLLPYLRDGLESVNLRDLIREAYFVPESKKIDALLEDFKSRRLHMAIVVDEFGGTAGIVTLEDVIEEIFGEISDEFDSEDWVYTKLSDNTYIFEGRIALNDVKKILDLDENEFEDARGDSDTLGGLILELAGKIPRRGDVIHYHNYDLHVESVSKNRIMMVKFVINQPEEESS